MLHYVSEFGLSSQVSHQNHVNICCSYHCFTKPRFLLSFLSERNSLAIILAINDALLVVLFWVLWTDLDYPMQIGTGHMHNQRIYLKHTYILIISVLLSLHELGIYYQAGN